MKMKINFMKIFNMMLFMVSISPWPLMFSLSSLTTAINMIIFFYSNKNVFLEINFFLNLLMFFLWWNDVILESTLIGFHNKYIILMNINSMILFIISEIFFFISFFWSYFHSMFSPDVMIGSKWPMEGINSIDYLSIPLLNSLLLISSGCSLTWSHFKLLINNKSSSKLSLIITLILGIMFVILQIFEYKFSCFSFSDGIYGSIFFIATGFHGIHVNIGILFLFSMLIRINKNHFSKFHMLGYEFAIWYWHFVDVIWLYLYMIIYWLGS